MINCMCCFGTIICGLLYLTNVLIWSGQILRSRIASLYRGEEPGDDDTGGGPGRDDGVGFLCDAISEQSEEEGIKVLILTNTGLTCEVGTGFNKVLNSSCILETLVLSLNDIGTEGIVRMKEGALRSRTLRHLELRGANIDCEGVAHLAQIIYFNPDLERLDLRDNPIKYPGLAALRDCLVLGAGPVEIELDDREKELQPFVEEIRKKSLGIGEDSFHCPPEERGEDFEEKVKLLLEKTLRRRREGDAYGMQHLAELVDQLKKELQDKKSGPQSEEKDEKEKEESSKKDKDKEEGSGDKCKPDDKSDKKDDDDGGPDGPQGKGPVQGMTGGSGGTEDKSKSDKSDDDKKGDDGSDTKGPVKEKSGKEDGGSDETQDKFKSDKKSDKDKKDDDDEPDAKGPVKEGGAQDKCKPDKKSEDDKKDDDDGGPDGPQGKGPVQMTGELSTTQIETSKKEDSNSQQGEEQPTQDGQKRQGTPVARANIDPTPEAVIQHHPPEQEQAESKIKSPAKPEGQKLQGILKKEVPPPVPDRSKKPIIQPKTGDETMTVQGNAKMKVNSSTQVECHGFGTMMEPPKEKTKKSKGKQKEGYFCEIMLPVKDEVAQGKSKKSDGGKGKTQAKEKEKAVKEAEKKDDIQSKIVGGARPKERTEAPKKEGKKKKRQKSPVKVERENQVENDFADQEEEELAYLAMQMSDPEEEYDYTRRYGNTKTMFNDESPDKPKKKLRSPEPSPRSSPLPFAMKERLKKSRGTCAAKDAMNEAMSRGMPRSNAMILGESMRRQTEMVVEEEEEGEVMYLTATGVETAEQVEESDDEDLLGAVGGAPKLPPRMPRPPPRPPKPMNQPKPAQKSKPPAPKPISDDDQPPPIPYPSKYAALGVRIPSCTRYNVHSWESVLRGSPMGLNRRSRNRSAASRDAIDPQRRTTISDWQRRRTDRVYHSTDEIYRAAISDPVENVYEQVLIPVMPIPNLTGNPQATQHRSRIFLHRSQNGELHQIEPTETANAIALSYVSEDDLTSLELHRHIARVRHNFLTTGSPFLRESQRDVETETDTSNAATRAIKNAFTKLKDNLNIFRRDEDSDFWELEYNKRYDLMEREHIRESATEQPAASASSSSARAKHRQNFSQTETRDSSKPRTGKGSVWSAKSSKIKGKSKKKLRYEVDQYVNGRYQPTWYHPDRVDEEWAYYDPKKYGYVYPTPEEQARSSECVSFKVPKHYHTRRAKLRRSQAQSSRGECSKTLTSNTNKEKQVEYEPDEKGNKVLLDPDKPKWLEYEPDEKGKKKVLLPDSDSKKWLEYEPDEKGKKKVLLPDSDSKKWLEYEPDEKGKKVEFDDGTTINWYEWEQEHNQPSTSRGTGGSGPQTRTALGSRLQATITNMSTSAARNI